MSDEEQVGRMGRPFRPVLNLERHWKMGLLVACVALVIGLPFVWIKGQSQYAAEGVFQVFPTYQKNLQTDKELEIQSNSQYRDFVAQMMRTVVRRDIVESMTRDLDSKGVRLCLSSERFRRCVERLQRLIYVVPVADSYMVKVGFSSSEKFIADQVVNGLLDEFIQKVRNEQIYGADERSSFLFEKRDALNFEVEKLVNSRNALAQDLGLTTFNDSTSNPYDHLLQQARERYATAQFELSSSRSAQRAFMEKGELPPSQGRSLLELRYLDSGLQTLRSEVIKRQEDVLKEIVILHEEHPLYPHMAEQKGALSSRLNSEEAKVRNEISRSAMYRLAAAISQAELIEKDARLKVDTLEGKAEWFSSQFRKAQSLTREINLREKELDEIRDRMRYLESESRALGFVRVIARALPADLPTGPGKSLLLSGLLLICLSLFFIVPIAKGWFDKRVTDVVDVERALNMNCVAWFVNMVNTTTEKFFLDQMRKLSGAIVRRYKESGTSVFGISSVRMGGGATLFAREIAFDLAKLGYKVNHILEPNSDTIGPVALTSSETDEYIFNEIKFESTGSVRNIFTIINPDSKDFSLLSFSKLVAKSSNDADFTFVEMPPFMSNPNIDLIVGIVEDIILIVEAMHITKANLLDTRDKLNRISPNSVAVVLNKLPLEHVEDNILRQFVENSIVRRSDEIFNNNFKMLLLKAKFTVLIGRIFDYLKRK